MCTCMYLWSPKLYIRNVLTAFSVHIHPHVDLNSLSTTFSRPGVHTSDFYGLFYMYVPPFAELIFTRDILWQHVHVPLVTHSVYIPRKCWFKSYVLPLHYLVGTLVILWTILFIFFSWWANLYLRNILWPCARTSDDLFCTHTSY